VVPILVEVGARDGNFCIQIFSATSLWRDESARCHKPNERRFWVDLQVCEIAIGLEFHSPLMTLNTQPVVDSQHGQLNIFGRLQFDNDQPPRRSVTPRRSSRLRSPAARAGTSELNTGIEDQAVHRCSAVSNSVRATTNVQAGFSRCDGVRNAARKARQPLTHLANLDNP
jgi:hypothetical protein